jgi:DNA-binding FadR family transcriptional regulator
MTEIAAPPRATPRPKLSAMVAETLRARLSGGQLHPGQRLPSELRLTREFGVSRTVVREALAALAADGLVEARQGAGVFVTAHPSLTFTAFAAADLGVRVSTAINVLEVRLAIEVESSALAATRHNASQLARIEEAFFDFEQNLRLARATGPADFAFHRAIAEATNNPFYVELLDALGKRAIPCDATSPWSTELAVDKDFQRGLQSEHHAILDAIAARDADAARATMRAHLARSQARYRDRIYERAALRRSDHRAIPEPERG